MLATPVLLLLSVGSLRLFPPITSQIIRKRLIELLVQVNILDSFYHGTTQTQVVIFSTSVYVSKGGWVEYNRVNGNLALSRALGDFVFKRNPGMSAEEQMVIAVPDVEVREITEDWEFILLACDGIWDVVTNVVS